ncbi:type I pullulanase [Priestia taiwanensis]|uniref:Type I pullulanase n=1 Tax=Priestia taiwanensis TaxID=1347902 RepID=A0A917AW09_9BACI|nr:type I pullulanase [Priestia taiwanensis]MBM7363384.1 pullulanase [Priestia taiwanensis]GGE77605.1 type I pullulanase [Priestia taiwanensis]
MLQIKRTFEAYIDTMQTITILVPKQTGQNCDSFMLVHKDERWELPVFNSLSLAQHMKYECRVPIPLEIGETYDVVDGKGRQTDLQVGAVIRTKEFDGMYAYDGKLGATYSEEKTVFRLWAPTASHVKLRIYEQMKYVEYDMQRREKGVWKIECVGDCDGFIYTYLVCVNLVWREATDPYSIGLTVNSEQSVVIDLGKTPRVNRLSWKGNSMTDAVIYEAHIRDITSHLQSGIRNKGKYIGIIEEATRDIQGGLTGLSYIKELGITHLQLLPFNDFGGVDEENPSKSYNWGYNPLHYNVPEGSYATNPYDPYNRITELKEMIRVLHQHGIRIIMDVVYNHVYVRESSSFEKIVPGYYFRHDYHGMPSNGTGVGNDLASERKMVRKYILDSIHYWVVEYGIDGFRFDLMGILDVETMNAIRQVVDEIDSSILLLGEGWDLNTPLAYEAKAAIHNADKMPRIAHFNDRFRDGVKGSTFHRHDKGFVSGNVTKKEEILRLVTGSISLRERGNALFSHPTQSVNYVECHDNYTMWDKLYVSNKDEEILMRRKRHLLATAFVLLSQGIPFLHSGQEFFRTKHGVENSYNAPDNINQLDWNAKEKHIDIVRYVKALIHIRRSHGAFRFSTAELIRRHMVWLETSDHVLGYTLRDVGAYGEWSDIAVFFNVDTTEHTVQLEEEDWYIRIQGEQLISSHEKVKGREIKLFPLGVTILFKI